MDPFALINMPSESHATAVPTSELRASSACSCHEQMRDWPREPIPNPDSSDLRTVEAERNALFVIPSPRGDGFRASIRGHLLELADPSSGHALAPTPDDLLILSIASDFAWFAHRFLRASGLDDQVSVSARWQRLGSQPSLEAISVTVTVAQSVKPMSDALVAALKEKVAARFRDLHARIRVSTA